MKKLFFIVFIIFFSCTENPQNKKSQNINDEESEYVDLIGKIERKDLTKKPYDSWFEENYDNYVLDIDTSLRIKKLISRDLKIKIIMGTWCTDSREIVPSFFKLMDYIKFNKRKIELIGLDVDKKNPNEDQIKYNIINVPTIIFYKKDEEINRIVELTIESIEKDILKILDGSGYENAYYGF